MAARAVVEEFFARMNAHDPARVLELVDEGVEWWIAGNLPVSGTHTKVEVGNLLVMLFQVFPDFTYTLHSIICEGDRVAAEAESSATHPEGKQYNNRYHNVFEIADGRIRACREYYDTLHTAEVMLGASVSL